MLRVSRIIGICLLLLCAPGLAQEQVDTTYIDTFAIQEALKKGETVAEVADKLLKKGYSPQLVAQEILILRPASAIEVAAAMALHSPEEAPFVAAAISWMAASQPAPVAAAVAAAVPDMAPEVASHVAAAFPQQTAAVARAVAESLPEQLTSIARTMGTAVPEEAAGVIRGIAPLIDSPLLVVDFLVEMFAALPIPLAAFVEPGAGLVMAVEGAVEKITHADTGMGESHGETTPEAEGSSADADSATETASLSDLPLGVAVGEGVIPGEALHTGAGARLMMVLRDGSVVSLLEQTRLHMGDPPDAEIRGIFTASLEKGLMRIVSADAKPHSWRFELGAGSLTVAAADALLARGDRGVGVILLRGAAIWADATGETRTLSAGRYRGDLLGGLQRYDSDANVYDWLSALGLDALDPGDLAEQSVWAATRLGSIIAMGDSGEIQSP